METPDVNQPVRLRSPEGTEYASRVEGLDAASLTLARPFALPLETTLDDGSPFDVLWTAATGLYELPSRVTERAVDGRVRVWVAEPTGPVRRTNRREHIRVNVAVPITVQCDATEVTGSLADLSESGLRLQAERALLPAELPVSVHVTFAVGGHEFDLGGTLLRTTPKGSSTELVITLPSDGATATALRRAVFAEQVRARQLD